MILVFGKTGQLATELQRQAGSRDMLFLGRDQADLSDPPRCAAQILENAPDLVINAAAYTAVDRAEQEPDLAQRINAEAPGAMARACAEQAIPFLHVSTDYVFDGSGAAAWREDDPVAPQNAYGRSKLAGENAILAAAGSAAILRTSWVFSAHGSNFVKTMLRLSESRDALSIVADQIGGPTAAGDIAAALLRMGQKMQDGAVGGVFHFGGQPPVSWADFAREIFALAGRDVRVTGIPSSDYPTPASRPLNSRMNCDKLLQEFGIAAPDWRASLRNVLQDLGVTS